MGLQPERWREVSGWCPSPRPAMTRAGEERCAPDGARAVRRFHRTKRFPERTPRRLRWRSPTSVQYSGGDHRR
ncbi:hypothetical protein HBB16_13915 [Pseudonocardia sp. MCCB 268]|nr:hypothetical protein [Pseudonocardia cytotoxica]